MAEQRREDLSCSDCGTHGDCSRLLDAEHLESV